MKLFSKRTSHRRYRRTRRAVRFRKGALPLQVRREGEAPSRPEGAVVTVRPDGLTIVAPSGFTEGWRIAAATFGIPWLLAFGAGSVWYLGWGVPHRIGYRAAMWLVLTLLTAAIHATALMTLWGAAYARGGTETLMIDPVRITLRRQAGRFPVEMHIRRGLMERAEALPPRSNGKAHPRIEVRAWRSALRFGAGLSETEAEECLAVLSSFFEREEEEEARRALTTARADDTIAPTQVFEPACACVAMKGTSRSTNGPLKASGDGASPRGAVDPNITLEPRPERPVTVE